MTPSSLVNLIRRFQGVGLTSFILCLLPLVSSSLGAHPAQARPLTGPSPEKNQVERGSLSHFLDLKCANLRAAMFPPSHWGAGEVPLQKTERKLRSLPGMYPSLPEVWLQALTWFPLTVLKTDVFPCWFRSGCFLSHTIKRSLRSINSHFRIASFCAALGSKLIYHEKPYSFSQALALSSSCRDQLLGCEPCSF